jgi:Holliday junction resolvasome RuvABC endonuclease subunit
VSRQALGYAVFKGTELQIFGVRGLYQRSVAGRQREASEFVSKLLRGFAPQVLAIDQAEGAGSVDPYSSSIRVALVELSKAAGVRISRYPDETIKRIVAGDPAATKGRVAETVTEWFPYLTRYLRIDLRTRKVYWRKMLDAVALAWVDNEERQRASVLRAVRSHNRDLRQL